MHSASMLWSPRFFCTDHFEGSVLEKFVILFYFSKRMLQYWYVQSDFIELKGSAAKIVENAA